MDRGQRCPLKAAHNNLSRCQVFVRNLLYKDQHGKWEDTSGSQHMNLTSQIEPFFEPAQI